MPHDDLARSASTRDALLPHFGKCEHVISTASFEGFALLAAEPGGGWLASQSKELCYWK